ncbi:MAG: type II toxin-antitoxin system VapC family toxin [Candidatus Bathyarchaeia archaeon]
MSPTEALYGSVKLDKPIDEPKSMAREYIRKKLLEETSKCNFVDTDIFIYAVTSHPRFGEAAKHILELIEAGEPAITSTLVLCEVAWVLEAMGRRSGVKPTLEKILSYESLKVVSFTEGDLLWGANNMTAHKIEFNDGVKCCNNDEDGRHGGLFKRLQASR